jgi:WD repeat-containing protein 35
LWRLLATTSLEELELNMAERAFVRCGDYYGIKLVQQLRSMPDKMKARAEVAV